MSSSPIPIVAEPRRSVVSVLALAALTLALGGCGGAGRPRCQPVSGVLLVRGKPTQGLCVSFHPLSADSGHTTPATGRTGKDGKFELSSFLPGDGAPPGEYTVTVTWPTSFQRIGEQEYPIGDRLGGAYAEQSKSPLKVTVREGVNQIPPLELSPK